MTPTISLIIALGGREITITKTSVYRLLAVSGLEAPPINMAYTSYAARDGGYITDRRVEPRTIGITFAVDRKKATEELRRSLIAFFRPHENGTLTVTRSGITRKIDFVLQTAPNFTQANIISDYLHVTATLICVNPYFNDDCETVVDMVERVPLLMFPLTSRSGVGATAGTKTRTATVTVTNSGDIPVGIVAEITSKGGAMTNPYIQVGDRAVAITDTTAINDVYTVNTRQGEKSVTKNGSKVYTFTATSSFFELPSGESQVTVSAESGAENMESTVKISMKYLGV